MRATLEDSFNVCFPQNKSIVLSHDSTLMTSVYKTDLKTYPHKTLHVKCVAALFIAAKTGSNHASLQKERGQTDRQIHTMQCQSATKGHVTKP